jgi:3',5'-cyclic-AMP phosphodiesterase
VAKTIAHLSDLHLGRSPEHDAVVARLREAADGCDHVIVTGDVTNRGRREELLRFEALFGDLARAGRLSVVPGNHDRLGDDVGARLMRGGRVAAAAHEAAGAYVVRVDSTGPHNRFLLAGHGDVDDATLDAIVAALDAAPRGALAIVALHHHPLPLPEETIPERISTGLGWPWAQELRLGRELLWRLRGRADLLLHGHRHVPRALAFFAREARPLGVYNAGCSTALGGFRVFEHERGVLLGAPHFLDATDALMPARAAAGGESW